MSDPIDLLLVELRRTAARAGLRLVKGPCESWDLVTRDSPKTPSLRLPSLAAVASVIEVCADAKAQMTAQAAVLKARLQSKAAKP